MSEHQMYEQIARYLQLQYPEVIYRFDLAADLKLTAGQAAKHKRIHSRRGYPDLFIAESRNGLHALFIELKAKGVRLKKKDGTWASSHLEEQNEILNQLQKKGYAAYFAVGFEETKQIIDDYLGGGE